MDLWYLYISLNGSIAWGALDPNAEENGSRPVHSTYGPPACPFRGDDKYAMFTVKPSLAETFSPQKSLPSSCVNRARLLILCLLLDRKVVWLDRKVFWSQNQELIIYSIVSSCLRFSIAWRGPWQPGGGLAELHPHIISFNCVYFEQRDVIIWSSTSSLHN